MNALFRRYGNPGPSSTPKAPNKNNILSQLAMLRNNQGAILDILLQSGKITQQQYNELQPYRNNPEMIGRYLINNGRSAEINQAQQEANNRVMK